MAYYGYDGELDEEGLTPCGLCGSLTHPVTLCPDAGVNRVHADVIAELTSAMKNWPAFNSAHEGYGVLREEFKELEEHVFTNQKKRDLAAMKKEAIQVAAMAIRFALEVCDERRGRK